MSGLSGLVKIVVALVLIVAAATGTEVVDVVEIADDVTVRAQSYVNDVEVDGDESELFDDSIDEFGRPTNKVPPALAFTDGTYDATSASSGSVTDDSGATEASPEGER